MFKHVRSPNTTTIRGNAPQAEHGVLSPDSLDTNSTLCAPANVNRRVAILLEDLENGDADIRCRALLALPDLGNEARPAVEKLISIVQLKQEFGELAIAALGAIGPAARKAVPLLVAALEDETTDGGIVAIALARLGETALAPLTQSLGHTSERVRLHAARALGMMGAAARDAISALEGRSVHDESEAGWAMKYALHLIDGRRLSE